MATQTDRTFETRIDIPEGTRDSVIELLNARLADTFDLYSQLKQAHWNVKGPHFIGLHAIHALLIAALNLTLLSRRVAWLRPERVRARLVGVAAFAYTGLMVTVTVQAFRGQSLIHPDVQTLGMLAGFVAISLAALAAIVGSARREATAADRTERVLVQQV